jgi:cytidylate kinase
MKKAVITIDGPAGAGKSTLARLLAERLSYTYLDTGALYRALAYRLLRKGWDKTEGALESLCRGIRIEIRRVDGRLRFLADGEDVTEKIRTEEIALLASRVSAFPAVREILLSAQRGMAVGGGLVAEGRDMGSVVFPDAEVKFFLDASAGERAGRRYREMTDQGNSVRLEKIRDDLRTRDRQDRSRLVSPLVVPPGAVVIDSTDKTISQVADIMLTALERAGHLPEDRGK